jgi:hypothetical protein
MLTLPNWGGKMLTTFKAESDERRALRQAVYDSGAQYKELNLALTAAVRAVDDLRTQVYALTDAPHLAIKLYDAEHPEELAAIQDEVRQKVGR